MADALVFCSKYHILKNTIKDCFATLAMKRGKNFCHFIILPLLWYTIKIVIFQKFFS